MLRVKPESGEDRAKILDYCEQRKLQVVNERDVDGCVVIDIEAEGIPTSALITGFKTNARAKFKRIEESMSLLKELIQLNEQKLAEQQAHATVDQVKRLTVEQVLDKADFCADGDDLTPITDGEDQAIDEVTTDDDGNPVVVVEAYYKRNRFTASIVFGPDLEVIKVYVEKDKNAFKR